MRWRTRRTPPTTFAIPVLRARLLTITAAVAEQVTTRGRTLRALMGSDVDARKLVSSLTLFEAVAASPPS